VESIAASHPANDGLRRQLDGRTRPDFPPLARPDEMPDPYMTLGTHPDLVARLWDELPALLPVDCRMIFAGTPALVHPKSGLVFGFATGTHTYALRLPPPVHETALAAGARRVRTYLVGPPFDLATVGAEWLFCAWLKGEEGWCLAAYEFASDAG
jgi:hypothetical protein